MPRDMRIFQRNRYAIVVRYDSRRIVRRRARCRHFRMVGVAVRRTHQLPYALHLHALRCATVQAIGEKFDLHRLRIEIIEIHLRLNYVPLTTGFDFHFAETKRGPVSIQRMPPFNQLLCFL